MVQPFTHDLYASLSHIEGLGAGDGQTLPPAIERPGYTWLNYDDARRLTAYRIMDSMRDNTFRFFLPARMWETGDPGANLTEVERIRFYLACLDQKSPAEKWREYGDAGMLVLQARSLMLGDSQDVVLPELDEAIKNQPDDEGENPEEGDAPETPEITRLRRFDDWLAEWVDAERLPLQLLVGEEHSVGNGDGVYALGWNEHLARPRLRVYEGAFYFPDLNTIGDDDDFPTVVHIAWETEPEPGKFVLHRKTWRLVEVGPDQPLAPAPYKVPWSDTKADHVCLYEVAEWDVDKLKDGDTLYNLKVEDSRAKVLVATRSLGVDFLTLVHVPNDASGARHFGKGILLLPAQLLSDVAGADSDLAANSELVGSTPLVTKGAGPGFTPNSGPGSVMDLPVGGDAKFLDTSNALTGLAGFSDHLLERLSVNTRLAQALLGRVQPNEVPSGYAFELGFAPTRSLIREMRMVRAEKHPLILKFALRLQQVFGKGDAALPNGPTPRAEIALGGYLPADKAGAVTMVSAGLVAHAMSTRTAVQILIDAGFPIEDAEAEVDRIRAEAFAAMVQVVDALGADGMTYVRGLLGIDQPEVLPPIPLPPTPPAPPVPPVPVPPVPPPPVPPAPAP